MRKPGRPVSLEKREAILRASSELFISKGYAVSMDEIAAAAGVSKQTLYGHFSSKEDLYRAYSTTWRNHYLETIEEGLDPHTTLTALAFKLIRKLTGEETVKAHRRLVEQANQFPDLALLHDEIGPRHTCALFAEYLSRLMREGVIREADPLLAAEDFACLALGMTRVRRLFGGIPAPTEDQTATRASHAAEVFLKAYGR